MAGAGYKLFNTGDVLTAAQVNTYLMEQTVMRFATTTARDTALSGVLAEGMICYIDADNNLYKYTGSAWVNIDSGSTSPLTTKGDLYTYSTTDARLAVGNNGETLVADSSTATGLKWAAPAGGGSAVVAGKNSVLNGDFGIWQRGTSFAITTRVYTADRWDSVRASSVGGQTVSRQLTSDTTNLPNIQYCARVQRDSGNTSTAQFFFTQSMESVNSIPLAGKQVTLSFYARRGANFSSTSNVLVGTLYGGTGTDQNYIAGYTGVASQAAVSATLTTTWTRFTATGTVGTNITELAVNFSYSPTGTAGAADYFEVTGVQLEVGASATDFSRAQGTLAGELAACQRYYYLHASGDSKSIGVGASGDSTNLYTAIQFPTTMRTAPTLSAASGTGFYVFYANGASDNLDSWTIDRASTTSSWIYSAQNNTTIGFAGIVRTANASASIAFSSEL